MHVKDLHVGQPVPWCAADSDLQAGIPVVYLSDEHGGLVQEFPDGRIVKVRLTSAGDAVPEDVVCPSFG